MSRITSSIAIALTAALLSAGVGRAADVNDPYGASSYGYGSTQGFNWSGLYAGGTLGYGWGESGVADTDGFVGGLTIGHNWQQGPVVFGLEGDIGYSGVGYSGLVDSYDVDWLGTGRGRIGYAFDRFMFFGTGGFAWTRANYEFGGLEESNNHFGWALGVGAEAAITPQLSAKVDYLHNSFSAETYLNRRLDPTINTLRVGLNYQF
jgi:outer membrane immunogenic protein